MWLAYGGEKPDTAGSPADWHGETLLRRRARTENEQPDEIRRYPRNRQLPEGIAHGERKPPNTELADTRVDASCYDETLETEETRPKYERCFNVENQGIDDVWVCRYCRRLWCRGGCRGHCERFGLAVGLGYLLALGLAGLGVKGCLDGIRAEKMQESLSEAAREVKKGSEEVVDKLGDRLDQAVGKLPTQFEIAPTEIQVRMKVVEGAMGRNRWMLYLVCVMSGVGGFLLGYLLHLRQGRRTV